MPRLSLSSRGVNPKLHFMHSDLPCVLAIGGLDPSGGAGLPADARAIAAFGGHCCGVATAVIAQNTHGVAVFEAVSQKLLMAQLDHLLEDITPRAVKIGMLPNVGTVAIVTGRLRQLRDVPIILDTVFAPSHGPRFADNATVMHIVKSLMPLADIVTPNIPEAVQLTDQPISDRESMIAAAQLIRRRYGPRHVLLKGGHWPQDAEEAEAVDVLVDAQNVIELRAPRVAGYEVRGTGCLLASAIAAQRGQGISAEDAARRAKSWLTEQIKDAKVVGHGRRVAAI